MRRAITVKTSFEGIHCYPEAPDEVSYLRLPHRHMFGVGVTVEVFHNDREIEFIMLKHIINRWLDVQRDDNDGVWHMERLSCEQVACMVADLVNEKFGVTKDGKVRAICVTVDEDGENGATVETTHDNKAPKEVPVHGNPHMTLAHYQKAAYQNIQKHNNHQEEVMHWAIGLGEEAGETLSVVKHKYYGGGYDESELIGELGDTLWHIAALCTTLGISLEDVAQFNLAKLRHRYPDGQFDYGRSLKRHKLNGEFKNSSEAKAIVAKSKLKGE